MNLVNFMRWLDDRDLDPYQHRLLFHIWRVGVCWKGVRRLADDTKMSRGKVAQVKAWALENGYIEYDNGEKGGVKISSKILRQFDTPAPTESVHHMDRVSTTWTECPPHGRQVSTTWT